MLWKCYNFGVFDNFLVFLKKVKIFDIYGYVHLENVKSDVGNFGILFAVGILDLN